jgi:hypothetical protein
MERHPPPTASEWARLPGCARWRIAILVWSACHIVKGGVPRPVHFGLVAGLLMFVLLPIMPPHPMSIPIVIGGGLAGALLIMGGIYAADKQATSSKDQHLS